MNLNEVVKHTLMNLSKEKKIATPDEYRKEFCKEAKRQGVLIKECEENLNRYTDKLPKELQKSIYNKNIHTQNDLIFFLIGELNRVKLQENRDFLDNLTTLIMYILKAISMLHNKEASSLAKQTFTTLSDAKAQDLISLKFKWKNFCDSYDSKFLQSLTKELATVDIHSIRDIVEKSSKLLDNIKLKYEKEKILQDYRNFSSLIIKSTVPAITSNLNTSILTLNKQLKHDPSLITTMNTQNEIKRLIKEGKELDRAEFIDANKKSQDILLNLMQLSNEGNFKKRISDVKGMLGGIDSNNVDIKKMELMNIIVSLEQGMNGFSDMIDDKQEDINALENKIKELEFKVNKLESEKEKFQSNFAGKVFEISTVKKLESSYKENSVNYIIILVRVDNHSQILNSYGQKTWTAIIHTLKKIIQKGIDKESCNQMDNRTFLAFINDKKLNEAIEFAKHIREAFYNSKFVIKGKEIEASVSIALASRNEDEQFEFAIKKAMDRLNIAKKHQNIVIHRENMAEYLNI